MKPNRSCNEALPEPLKIRRICNEASSALVLPGARELLRGAAVGAPDCAAGSVLSNVSGGGLI
jgi:hypothetical protein